MGGWNGVYTNNGLALLAKLTQGSTLEITRAVTGTGIVSDDLLISQTAVTGIKQTMNFQPATYPEPGTCKLPMFVNNEGVGAGYTVHQIGLYATDPDIGEILYFIAQSSNGTDVPSAAEVAGYVGTWTFYFQYGQADNVTVYVDPSNAVTVDMLEEVRILAMRGVSTPKIGNSLAFYDAANLPYAGFSVYGRSAQAGTGVPTEPVEIESIGDNGEIKLTVASKNLIEVTASTTTHNGVTFTVNEDGSITADGAATETAFLIATNTFMPVVGKRYILSGCPDGGSYETYRLDYWGGGLNLASLYGGSVVITPTAETPITIRPTVNTDVPISHIVFKPMLRVAEIVDDEYEKFIGQNVALPTPNGLHGIPVTSGGNFTDTTGQQWICDEIDLVRGVYVQRVAVINHNTSFASPVLDPDSAVWRATLDTPMPAATNYPLVYCTHYKRGSRYDEINKTNFTIGVNDSGQILLHDDSCSSSSDVSARLTNADFMLIYPLKTPIETTIAVDTLHSYNPHTTVFNTSGADMLVDCIRDVNENAFEIVLNQSRSYPQTTTITVADGGEYRYKDAITALAVSYPAGTFECWIKFLTGSTFTLTLPSETTYIGSIPDFAASTWYELSIKDGVAIFGEVGAGE